MEKSTAIFAKNLRALIKRKGYRTVELFAHENNFEKGWVYRLVRAERDPILSSMVKLAKALDVTLEDLYPMKRKRK